MNASFGLKKYFLHSCVTNYVFKTVLMNCVFSVLFQNTCSHFAQNHFGLSSAIDVTSKMLENIQFYQTDKADCWIVDDACVIQQTHDGFVR